MEKEKKMETICSLCIAIFAAILAVTNIWSSKFSDDVIIAFNEKTNAYDWYNSKGIKQNLAEGQKEIVKSLLDSGLLPKENTEVMNKAMKKLDENIKKYKKEKNEILNGSRAVGKDNWVQDVDGKMGEVIGAKEWELKAKGLYNIGDTFNLSILFLQITIVLGAIILILKIIKLKVIGLFIMITLGSLGTLVAIYAFYIAFSIV